MCTAPPVAGGLSGASAATRCLVVRRAAGPTRRGAGGAPCRGRGAASGSGARAGPGRSAHWLLRATAYLFIGRWLLGFVVVTWHCRASSPTRRRGAIAEGLHAFADALG